MTLEPQKAQQPGEPVYESRLPKPLAQLKRWLVAHHMTLMTIADTPHSIALGSAIGIFFGFTPLYPLKTLLSIAVAWVFRCNKIAAAIAVTLHDVVIWAMPAIYVAEYQFGCWSTASAGGATRASSPVSTARLRALARIFTRRLAHLLARIYWFALPRRSFGDHCLLSHAPADQPRQNSAED